MRYFIISVFFANIMTVVTASARWFFMIRKEIRSEKFGKYLSTYWAAMFYGYFVPSNAGMDVYRVAVAGKKLENYEKHIAMLLGEKIYTLVISFAVMFLSFAAVFKQVEGSEVAYAVTAVGLVLLFILLLVLLLYLIFRKRFSSLAAYLINRFYHYAGRIFSRLSTKISIDFQGFRGELPYLTRKGFFTPTFLFTLLLRIWLAVGGYFLFLAFGIKLSFWALFFSTSVFFLIFIMPISFGSLGVREGAYILIFGLFGINPETALAASFLALTGLVFILSVGGFISLAENLYKFKNNHGE